MLDDMRDQHQKLQVQRLVRKNQLNPKAEMLLTPPSTVVYFSLLFFTHQSPSFLYVYNPLTRGDKMNKIHWSLVTYFCSFVPSKFPSKPSVKYDYEIYVIKLSLVTCVCHGLLNQLRLHTKLFSRKNIWKCSCTVKDELTRVKVHMFVFLIR